MTRFPLKQWLLSSFLLPIVIIMLLYIQSEINRLDKSRVNLELVVQRLETERFKKASLSNEEIWANTGEVTPNSDEMVVIYNRVPKTASTSFAGIAYDLCLKNHFNVLHLNVTKNSHLLSLPDQMRFAQNISKWVAKKPALYHGHIAYLDFSKLGEGLIKPIYINIIRDPLERLVSYYYFLRNGDDFRPHLKRRKSGNKESFDECAEKDGKDCDPENLWMQIPFFCGHAAECWYPGSNWALEQAKYNLVNNYLVVGLTEELNDFVAVLEAVLPRFFKGATHLYGTGRKSHLRKTFNKLPVSEETINKFQDSPIWKLENEFYQFAKYHFHFIKKRTFALLKDGHLQQQPSQFSFEKIRPR
ncbi:DgyrCDS10021 [Dimorphilus gyrociliatus]|uniref:DgyrCDS10021 n=2 Tax=Dimorphilus gyrociliatus TaxID=2664684 RepID=A0A7I8W1J4_9ANNE|nr:DgyrCDS10021 [Dimorphilus gyrociliatus]